LKKSRRRNSLKEAAKKRRTRWVGHKSYSLGGSEVEMGVLLPEKRGEGKDPFGHMA